MVALLSIEQFQCSINLAVGPAECHKSVKERPAHHSDFVGFYPSFVCLSDASLPGP